MEKLTYNDAYVFYLDKQGFTVKESCKKAQTLMEKKLEIMTAIATGRFRPGYNNENNHHTTINITPAAMLDIDLAASEILRRTVLS